MINRLFRVAPVVVTTILLGLPTLGEEHKTFARFDLPFGSPQDGRFPSDRFTVEDGTQNTGLRVSLSTTECQVSDCEDLDVINELDGFNLQPRVSIPFIGTINPHTVTGETVFLVELGSTLPGQEGSPSHGRVSIDQVVWDPTTETLHVESDKLLDQHTRYVLVVTVSGTTKAEIVAALAGCRTHGLRLDVGRGARDRADGGASARQLQKRPSIRSSVY